MYYNHSVFLVYLGGLFSLILTVAIIFIKDNMRREAQRKYYNKIKESRPDEVGDIEAKLDDDGFKSPSIFRIVTTWGIQPLLILWFLSLFSLQGELVVSVVFFLLVLTLLHEFYMDERYSSKRLYQLFILAVWVITFFINSYITNLVEQQKKIEKVGQEKDSAS